MSRDGTLQSLRHTADLDWFFNDRFGDLGYHGQNYDPDRWRGDSPDPERFGLRRTASVQREARVLGALRLLTQDEQHILSAAYSEHRWRGLERWGRAAGVGAWLYDREDKVDGGLALAQLTNQKGAEGWLDEHRRKAEEALRGAEGAYQRAEAAVVAERDQERAVRVARDRRLAEAQGAKWAAPVEEEWEE